MSRDNLEKANAKIHGTPDAIGEMNKVIALFMGAEFKPITIGDKKQDYLYLPGAHITDYIYDYKEQLFYHSDWSELISVCVKCREKVESFSGDLAMAGKCGLYEIYEALQTFNVCVVYGSVYKFIEWYNKNSNGDKVAKYCRQKNISVDQLLQDHEYCSNVGQHP